METIFENPLCRQNQSGHTNKAQAEAYVVRPSWPEPFLVHASGKHEQNFPRLQWDNSWPSVYHLRKSPYHQSFVNQAFTKEQPLSLNFVFLMARAWDWLKFLHEVSQLTLSKHICSQKKKSYDGYVHTSIFIKT